MPRELVYDDGTTQFFRVTDDTGAFVGWDSSHPTTSSSGPVDVTDRAGRLLGHVAVDSLPAVGGSVAVTNLPGTQPVSGAVTVSNLPATQPVSGSVSVANFPSAPDVSDRAARLLGHVAVDSLPSVAVSNFPSTQPVSGTVAVGNFPATQDVADRSARLLGHVTVDAHPAIAGAVSVTNLPATQPVSGTVGVNALPALPAGANAIGSVSVSNFPATQPVSGTLSVGNAVSISNFPATQPVSGTVAVSALPASAPRAADLVVSATGLTGAAVTATLPAVVGQFHYITRIQVVKYATAAVTGVAVPTVVTTTNLPGSLAFTLGTAQAIGTTLEQNIEPAQPLKSSVVNTATTIVCPLLVGVLYRINVFYFTAP